jgi:hypothetical protein
VEQAEDGAQPSSHSTSRRQPRHRDGEATQGCCPRGKWDEADNLSQQRRKHSGPRAERAGRLEALLQPERETRPRQTEQEAEVQAGQQEAERAERPEAQRQPERQARPRRVEQEAEAQARQQEAERAERPEAQRQPEREAMFAPARIY